MNKYYNIPYIVSSGRPNGHPRDICRRGRNRFRVIYMRVFGSHWRTEVTIPTRP